jgi:hypothetical protein
MRRPRVAVDMTVGLFAWRRGSAAGPASPPLLADTDALAARPKALDPASPPLRIGLRAADPGVEERPPAARTP